MALFGTLNVMGPAHRGAQIQQLAQAAAQNVMRRQRMRKAIQSGAAAAAQSGGAGQGHAAGGPGMRLRGSDMHPMVGVRGHVQRPNLTADQLAQMARAAAGHATLPGGRDGGVFGSGGGGFDFGSIPDPRDPSQSPSSLEATAAVQSGGTAPSVPGAFDPSNPYAGREGIAPGTEYNPVDSSGNSEYTIGPGPGPNTAPTLTENPNYDPLGMNDPTNNTWIPLGNGMYYNPSLDAVRGMPQTDPKAGLVGIDRKF